MDDIDLYVGAMIEKKEEGVNVGPTFQCIMGAQYANLKVGPTFQCIMGAQYANLKVGSTLRWS